MLTGDGLEIFKPLMHRVEKMAKCLTIFQHYTFYLQVNLLSHLLLIKITDQNILTSFLVSTAEAAVQGCSKQRCREKLHKLPDPKNFGVCVFPKMFKWLFPQKQSNSPKRFYVRSLMFYVSPSGFLKPVTVYIN